MENVSESAFFSIPASYLNSKLKQTNYSSLGYESNDNCPGDSGVKHDNILQNSPKASSRTILSCFDKIIGSRWLDVRTDEKYAPVRIALSFISEYRDEKTEEDCEQSQTDRRVYPALLNVALTSGGLGHQDHP